MDQRRLGNSGLSVSVLGLGCNNLGRPGTPTHDLDGTRAVIDAALDAGVTFFDVADVYGAPRGRSEELLGQALRDRRDQVLIATKFGLDMRGDNGPDFGARASRRYVIRSVEASLRRLDTDWIDLYQLHRPDPDTPVEETLHALDELIKSGKVRYAGLCNLAAWQVADAVWLAGSGGLNAPISAQNHYSLLEREVERELLPACERFGLGLLPYFPLANGLLTGKYRSDQAPPEGSRLAGRPRLLAEAAWDRLDRLRAFATDRGISLTDVAVGWLAANPRVGSVIAGATTPTQVKANAASAAWRPGDGDLAEIDRICPPGGR